MGYVAATVIFFGVVSFIMGSYFILPSSLQNRIMDYIQKIGG